MGLVLFSMIALLSLHAALAPYKPLRDLPVGAAKIKPPGGFKPPGGREFFVPELFWQHHLYPSKPRP